MNPHVVYVVALLLVLYEMRRVLTTPRYACPSCGTTNEREHADHCAWARHYEREDSE